MFGGVRNHNSITADSNLTETATPRHSLLSARFKQSFAYLTLRNRIPGIMQQIVVQLSNEEEDWIKKHGEGVVNDLRRIRDQIDRLGRDLKHDRQFTIFTGCEPDKEQWNSFITDLPKPKRTFFRSCWLHAECYLYRKMYSFIENSTYFKNYDYFAELKQNDLRTSVSSIETLCSEPRDATKSYTNFRKMFFFALWSNRLDMRYVNQTQDIQKTILTNIKTFKKNVLVDDVVDIWNCLIRANRTKKPVVIDFVCDNAGFEFFVDMLLIEYLLDSGLAAKLRLHVKQIPWYISDLTKGDIDWTIKFFKGIDIPCVNDFAKKWENYVQSGCIEIGRKSYFWTGPHSYFVMSDLEPDLYKDFTTGHLALFKGDLNYRKLMGDYIWDSTEEFITCLRGFRPTNIAAMRTIKSEVVCGLPDGRADYLLKIDPQWMITGAYAVIQYTDSLKCHCAFLDRGRDENMNSSGLHAAPQK